MKRPLVVGDRVVVLGDQWCHWPGCPAVERDGAVGEVTRVCKGYPGVIDVRTDRFQSILVNADDLGLVLDEVPDA